jgi:hypothetical protein
MKINPRMEEYRFLNGDYGSPRGATYGRFFMPGPCGSPLTIMTDDGRETGWEHVSVSTDRRIPNWIEMCFAKDLFWAEDECVVQFHPQKSDYVNNHPRCLHMWRYTRGNFPTPPSILVGYKSLGTLKVK